MRRERPGFGSKIIQIIFSRQNPLLASGFEGKVAFNHSVTL
jgi:hypothetical protein